MSVKDSSDVGQRKLNFVKHEIHDSSSRRPFETLTQNLISQNRGRPQGNINKTENRGFRKKQSGSFKVLGLVDPAVKKPFGPGGILFLEV